jgi:hypothetical protein
VPGPVRNHTVTLFDIELVEDVDPELDERLGAYRGWCRR